MAAYRQLYNRYAKAMFNTALRIVNSVADAEDVLQEAFTDAFLQLKKFENRSTFGAWLRQIVVYKSIGVLKKKRISFTGLEDHTEVAEETEEESIWYTVDTIREAIQELPDGYRTVLSLHLFEGYDQEEIAATLGVALSTVRSQYMRGKQKLVSLLKVKAANEQ
ncbi:MAG: RNA polymerase sigma factor [Chitinophagaceae bacterium]